MNRITLLGGCQGRKIERGAKPGAQLFVALEEWLRVHVPDEYQRHASGIQPPLQSVGHIVHVIDLAPQMLNLVNDQKLDAQASNEFVDAHTKQLFCPGTPVGVMNLETDILEYR